MHEEMRARWAAAPWAAAQWAQVPVPSSFQEPQAAQHYSHPGAIGPVQPTYAPGGVLQPTQSFYTAPPQIAFNQSGPPPWTNMRGPPSGLNGHAPSFAPAPGFGNLPPSGLGLDPQLGFNNGAQPGFHQVPYPSFAPVPEQVTGPSHQQVLAKQAPKLGYQVPHPGFPCLPEQVTDPGHQLLANQAPKPDYQVHLGFPPVAQQVTGPSHQQELAKQAPNAGMCNPFPDPIMGHVPFAHVADYTNPPIEPGFPAAANVTAHNPNGQFHSNAIQENLIGKHTFHTCTLP